MNPGRFLLGFLLAEGNVLTPDAVGYIIDVVSPELPPFCRFGPYFPPYVYDPGLRFSRAILSFMFSHEEGKF